MGRPGDVARTRPDDGIEVSIVGTAAIAFRAELQLSPGLSLLIVIRPHRATNSCSRKKSESVSRIRDTET